MSLWSTEKVATELAMSEEWVRANAPELGGIRMGRSARSPLRFDPKGIEDYKHRQRLEAISAIARKPQRPGPRRVPQGVTLFPVGVDD